MAKLVRFEKKDNVGIITLNRPETYNAVNGELSKLAQQYLDQCASDDDIRAIVLQSTGKAFSSGQDLKEIKSCTSEEISRVLNTNYNPWVLKLRSIPKPVVCAVQGVAAGAGANVALACDIVVAGHNAKIIQAFTKIGLIPDSGGTYTLPRMIGLQKAKALSMLADTVTGREAEQMGMIYKSVDDGTEGEVALELATRLSQMPTKAIGYTKEALNRSFENSFEEQLLVEEELQIKAAATHDFTEGVAAFKEKRKPIFKGK